jgi:hypothetical protein
LFGSHLILPDATVLWRRHRSFSFAESVETTMPEQHQMVEYGDSLLYVSRQLRWSRGVRLHSRFWAGFAGCQREAEPALENRDPFRPPQRAAGGGDPFDPGRRRAASAGIARRAAKSEISARNGATVVNSSSSPASCARVLDRGQRGTAHQATIGLSAMYDAAANRCGLSITTAPKRPLEQMARPSEPMLIAAV